jgi:isocitrate lyase
MVGKLRIARNVADDCGNPDFVIISRTDGLSACEAPESLRHMDLAVERGLRYLETGIPDLLWCEFPTSDRGPLETFTTEIRKRFPKARFAFNWSSSFKWYNDPNPLRFSELGQLGVKFIFVTLGGQHATGLGMSNLLQAMAEKQEQGYIALQQQEWADGLTERTFQRRAITFFRVFRTTISLARCTTRPGWAGNSSKIYLKRKSYR